MLLRNLPRHERVPRAEPSIHRPGLPVDIASLIAGKEECDAGDLIGLSAALQRVQLADFALRTAGARRLKRGRCHARLNEARAHGVDPDSGPRQLVRARLRHRDYSGFRSGVGRGTRVRSDAGDGGGADDAAA